MDHRRPLFSSANGFTLRPMVAAVIYVRVSTKEQTENLSLPTQLRACEEYCGRQGYEILERFHEEGEIRQVHRPQPASEPADVLPDEQEPRAFRGRLQLDTVRARQVRPLRSAVPTAIARYLAALCHRADRRHVHWQVDGRRARRVRAVRQRLSL